MFKQLDEVSRAKKFRVFGSDLNHNGNVLSEVESEHLVKTCQGLLHSELAEEVYKPFGVVPVSMNHTSLDVVDVLVVLQCLLSVQP